MERKKKDAAHTQSLGNIHMAVWPNKTTRGVLYNTTLQRSYTDEDEKRRYSDSFSPRDLLKVLVLLLEALVFIHSVGGKLLPEKAPVEVDESEGDELS